MEAAVQGFVDQALAPSTSRSYNQGLNHYNRFCHLLHIAEPFPLSNSLLCSFAAYLGNLHLSPQSIKVYLAGVKHHNITLGYRNVHDEALKLVERGIARHHSTSPHSPSAARMPITPDILRQIMTLWSDRQYEPDTIMLWAALCSGFFGCLRIGEFTSPSPTHYDPSIHLSFGDIWVDSKENTSSISMHIKQSKTDQLRHGSTVTLARTGQNVCPVAALLAYLASRGGRPGPLFIFQNGKFLTPASLTQHLRQALDRLGYDSSSFAGHSLRIGAATTAARCGHADSTIKALGRWRSTAYLRYIKRDSSDLATVSRDLAKLQNEAQ